MCLIHVKKLLQNQFLIIIVSYLVTEVLARQLNFGSRAAQIKQPNRDLRSDLKFIWASENDVKFLLFTRTNPETFEILKINDTGALYASNFDFNSKVKLIVHGWISNGTSFVAESIKNAYLQTTDANIIILDWNSLARSKYLLASYYVNSVAAILTDFLKFLVDQGVSTDDIHLVGHSLGAHVVGIAGKYYNDQRKPINAITGLDPAYPLYKYTNEDWKLDKQDARHVQVIHTCAGFLGFPTPLGHIDFYPNGGSNQPGCGLDFFGTCAHDRAVEFFAYSMLSEVPFTAVKCESYERLQKDGYCDSTAERLDMSGLDLHHGKTGVYYLKTKSEVPFAMGDPSNWT